MRPYEGMFVIDAALPEAEQKKIASTILELIAKNGARVMKEQLLGKRRLTYRMRKKTEGIYYNIYFEAEPSKIKEMKRQFMLSEYILKFLITRTGD